MADKNNADEINKKVQERAYILWEEEGRPEGRHGEHWNQAEKEFKSPDKTGSQKASSAGIPDKKFKDPGRESSKNAPAEKAYKSSKK